MKEITNKIQKHCSGRTNKVKETEYFKECQRQQKSLIRYNLKFSSDLTVLSDNNTYYKATVGRTGWHPHTNRLMDTTWISDVKNNGLLIQKKTHFSSPHIQK